MAELRRVAGPSSPLGGRDGRLIAIVVGAIVLAIVKPWAATSGPAVSPRPSATPSATPALIASAPTVSREPFDFGVFEGFEPPPAWEIWPAGREFSLGFAMRINADDQGPSTPAAGASGSPAGGSATPRRSPTVTAPVDAGPPSWSGRVAIAAGSRLTVVAINMPLGYAIPRARLVRIEPGRGRIEIPLIRLPSPWPDHFIVLGLNDGGGRARPDWPPGEYALDLTIAPGDWSRTIRIDVAAPPPVPASSTEAASPAEAVSPSPAIAH